MSNKGGFKFKLKQDLKRKSSVAEKDLPNTVMAFTQPFDPVPMNVPSRSRNRIPKLEIPSIIPPDLSQIPEEEKMLTLFNTVVTQTSAYVSKHFAQHPEASSIFSKFYSNILEKLNSKQKDYFKKKKSRLEEIEQEIATAKKIVFKNYQDWNENSKRLLNRINVLKSTKMVEEVKDIEKRVLIAARNREDKAVGYSVNAEDESEIVTKIKEKVSITKQRQKIKNLFERTREVFNTVKQKRDIEARKALNEFYYFLPVIQGDPVNLIEALSQMNIQSS